MSVIKLHTANERLIFDEKPMLTSGNIGIDSISVSFCDNWKQLGDVGFWVTFFKDESEELKVKLDNGECKIPSEMLIEKGAFYFGVYAENANYEEVKTSIIVKYCVGQGITTKGEAESNLIKAATAELKADLDRIKATHLDTTEITDYTQFFMNGRRAEILGKVDTSNATKVMSMYASFDSLETAPSMNTSKVEAFDGMFSDCSALKQAPELDTSNGKYFSEMFARCHSLETPPNYDMGIAEDLGMMFYQCSEMAGVINFDTKNCTNLNNTFAACRELTEIQLTDTSKVENFSSAFTQCVALHTISKLNMRNGGYNASTFANCTALKNVEFEEVKITNNNFTLTTATMLTAESLVSLMYALVDNTGGTAYTIKLGSTNIRKIPEDVQQIAFDKNYYLA